MKHIVSMECKLRAILVWNSLRIFAKLFYNNGPIFNVDKKNWYGYGHINQGVYHLTNWYTHRIRDLLSAITHPSRVAILEFLSDRDFGTNKSLRQHLKSLKPKEGGDSPAVVTHHVSLLEKTGLIKHSEEDARVIVATAMGRRITRMLRQMVTNSDFEESWDRSL